MTTFALVLLLITAFALGVAAGFALILWKAKDPPREHCPRCHCP